ncbi:rCG49319 [Rattus norvegicus]|uniref:RCG49319 n=1 Tax=Rattus norvegicus TaxID=10116 RepID=A6J2E7_RAT|nr:rCG49319 [Rattus norvegicus]
MPFPVHCKGVLCLLLVCCSFAMDWLHANTSITMIITVKTASVILTRLFYPPNMFNVTLLRHLKPYWVSV